MPDTITIPGDVGGLQGLAAQMQAAAADIDGVGARVAGNGLEGSWSGTASEAFRSSLHELPGELSKAGGAFGEAASALSAFAARLAELQEQAAWYDAQVVRSEDELREASERSAQAQVKLNEARVSQSIATDPVSLTTARNAVSLGESLLRQAADDVSELGSRIAELVSGGNDLRAEYEAAVRSCCGVLDGARHSGGRSFAAWLRHKVGDLLGSAGHEVGGIWHDGAGEIERVGDEALHELDEHWEEVRGYLAVAGEVIAMASLAVLAVGVVVGTGGIATPLLMLGLASLADAGTTELGDAVEADRGNERDRKRLLGDTVNILLSAVGVLGAVGDVAKTGEAVDDASASGNAIRLQNLEKLGETATEQTGTLLQQGANKLEGVSEATPRGIGSYIDAASRYSQPIVLGVDVTTGGLSHAPAL